MARDFSGLAGMVFPGREQHYSARDAMLYALGLGLGLDPLDEKQLSYVFEEIEGGLKVLPAFAVTLAYPGHWLREAGLGLDWAKAVHVEQGLRMHRPLPSSGRVVAQTRITRVVDKGEGNGLLLYSERQICDHTTGEALADISVVTLARGDGGRGGERAQAPVPHPLPSRAADASMLVPSSPQGSLIYRLCADANPLHASPQVARAAGFERPIAHGLWTYGIASYAVVELSARGETQRLASLSCRFRSPAFAGDAIRIECWLDGSVASFRATVPARGVTVLDHGRADLLLG